MFEIKPRLMWKQCTTGEKDGYRVEESRRTAFQLDLCQSVAQKSVRNIFLSIFSRPWNISQVGSACVVAQALKDERSTKYICLYMYFLWDG